MVNALVRNENNRDLKRNKQICIFGTNNHYDIAEIRIVYIVIDTIPYAKKYIESRKKFQIVLSSLKLFPSKRKNYI